jgi:hypothetical protein
MPNATVMPLMPSVIMTTMLSVITLSVAIMPQSVIMLSVAILPIMPSVTIMPNISVIMPNVIRLNVILLSVVTPSYEGWDLKMFLKGFFFDAIMQIVYIWLEPGSIFIARETYLAVFVFLNNAAVSPIKLLGCP